MILHFTSTSVVWFGIWNYTLLHCIIGYLLYSKKKKRDLKKKGDVCVCVCVDIHIARHEVCQQLRQEVCQQLRQIIGAYNLLLSLSCLGTLGSISFGVYQWASMLETKIFCACRFQ